MGDLSAEIKESETPEILESGETLNLSPLNTHVFNSPKDAFDSLKFMDSEAKDIPECLINPTETKTDLTLNSPDPIEQLNAMESVMVGPGLDNIGNSCFVNAVLQCCIHIVPFAEGLLSCGHVKPCKSFIEGFCLICILMHIFDAAVIGAFENSIAVRILVHNISKISTCLMNDQQEDAHEFLQCLLDKLEPAYVNGSDFVKQIFGGRLVSRIECCKCGHCSDTYEPMNDLSLEIENVFSLEDALKSFTNVERIGEGEAQFTCVSCGEKVVIEKQLELDSAPFVASFHLKRFKYNGVILDKIDKHIEFPLELDLRPYTRQYRNSNIPLMYDLYAIVVHSGFSPTSGHYYSFVRSAPDAWFKMDDHKVTRVDENFVLSEEAYILFYAKKGTPMFSTYITHIQTIANMILSNRFPTSILENEDQSSSTVAANNVEFSDYVIPTTLPRSPNVGEDPSMNYQTIGYTTDEVKMKIDSSKRQLEKNDEEESDDYVTPTTPPRSPNVGEDPSMNYQTIGYSTDEGKMKIDLSKRQLEKNDEEESDDYVTPTTPPRSPNVGEDPSINYQTIGYTTDEGKMKIDSSKRQLEKNDEEESDEGKNPPKRR